MQRLLSKRAVVCYAITAAAALAAVILYTLFGYDETMFQNKNPYRINEQTDLSFLQDGVEYRYNENIINILLLGIDKTETRGANYIVENGYQADVIFLLSVDTKTGDVALINIPRDTLTEIMHFDRNGDFSRIETGPICTAHSFGDGGLKSGQLMEAAVSNLMYGIPIDRYIAMDIDGISKLTDVVGGVEVELLEDFTVLDPGMTKGTLYTLNGEQAEHYVRSRQLPGMSGEDAKRIPRQVQFIEAFVRKVAEMSQTDKGFFIKLLEIVGSHTTTDMTDRELRYVGYTFFQKVSIISTSQRSSARQQIMDLKRTTLR